MIEPPSATDLAVRFEPNPRWIRGLVSGSPVVSSRRSLFVWEHHYYPQWYFPLADVAAELRPSGVVEPTDGRGDAVVCDVVIDASTANASTGNASTGNEIVLAAAARIHPNSPIPELRDRVRFIFDAFDRWLEEDVEVTVHPRSPYTRVDVLPSSRNVKISLRGTVVAESNRPSILYETGLPPRYYLPFEDVSAALTPSEASTACPYKGRARYWSVTVDDVEYKDIVWGYDDPLPESAAVRGLVCFYNEKVDIELDGEPQTMPVTKFS